MTTRPTTEAMTRPSGEPALLNLRMGYWVPNPRSYLESAPVPGMRFGELGFGSRRAGFPRESTVDQFFDEEQLDAHRRLGCELARRMSDEVSPERRLRE